jgi:hypothetical protein
MQNPDTPDATPDDTRPTAGSAQNAIQNPDEWVTEDQPMTEAQASLLWRLCEAAGEPFDAELSKAHAAQRIEALQQAAAGEQLPPLLMDEQTDG